MQKNIVLWDVLCYAIIPLIVWNMLREYIGDYYAMLLSTVPGILYSFYRFYLVKKVNLFGMFLLGSLIIGTLVDVLAGSAMQMLWNNVYYAYAMAAFYLLTILVNRPIFLYFSLDLVELQGADRKEMKKIFYQKKILFIFKLVTFGFALRSIGLALIKTWLIQRYGVEAFDQALIARQVFSWGMTGIAMLGFVYISKLIKDQQQEKETAQAEG
ncbi:VC0807 family protein [Thalassobacillus hwangdonensis]|uniref:VC0807 family protein n=1 Tax=Thalassobacillus hwangdonensis TaxID=546108 RepID=A0ABW3L415_9BACI